jgi:hypothetical protein
MPFKFASPEELTRLEAELERAWAMVTQRRVCDPLSVPGERERLAYIIAALWQQGVQSRVAETAFEQFVITEPRLSSMPTAVQHRSNRL